MPEKRGGMYEGGLNRPNGEDLTTGRRLSLKKVCVCVWGGGRWVGGWCEQYDYVDQSGSGGSLMSQRTNRVAEGLWLSR